ncbi:hypothetical protein MLD38_019053 [Melastoma candidum]|uniref:Uncharacterized protein n=1 Tax=Melastoma candidum TaxID=119954 RepID=A0ACB9QVP8_9MYRT|nr:hypothetical protein MLD38_019053 [Melastoma candidum]
MRTERDDTSTDLENGRAAIQERGIFERANLPITLKFEDVVYKIKVQKPGGSGMSLTKGGNTVEKVILKGITGIVRPGEILAMLGPSGSGKTTLLTAIGGRLGGGRLEGRVMYNGRPFLNSLKRATGFVTQDDIMYPHLTVAETLMYTALLRLPKTLSKPEKSDMNHLQDKIGLLFFYSAFWGFFPMFNAIFTFPQERSMLDKERSSGMYRLSSYFLARIVGDLPMELILPTIFLTITYWMSGMHPDLVTFLRTLLTLLYSVLVAQGVGLAIGALVMDQRSATTLGSVVMLSFLLAGGYYVQKVPQFIAWIRYISISHYTYKLLLGSQFDLHSTYPCKTDPTGLCLVGEYPAVREVGLSGQAVAAIALGVMFIGYRLIAYLALMRIGVAKR